MNRLDDLKRILIRHFSRPQTRDREMKRDFQLTRYFEWNDLTPQERISAKRFLLIPIVAYLLIGFLNQNLTLIIVILIVYFLYKKCERGGIQKK